MVAKMKEPTSSLSLSLYDHFLKIQNSTPFPSQMGHISLEFLATAGHLTPKDGGFHLFSGEEVVFEVPERWSGRVWGRQGFCFDEEIGKSSCQTGDCAGLLHSQRIGGVPLAIIC
nr:thaumatin-like protein [Quercus suber]